MKYAQSILIVVKTKYQSSISGNQAKAAGGRATEHDTRSYVLERQQLAQEKPCFPGTDFLVGTKGEKGTTDSLCQVTKFYGEGFRRKRVKTMGGGLLQ